MKKSTTYLLFSLTVIFLIGLFLRAYRLDLNIPNIYADEAGHYTILESIFDGRLNIFQQVYSLLFSFTWFLGLTPLGARLPAVVFGSMSIIVFYFFGLLLSGGNKKVALAGSWLVAIVPWSFMISRIGHTHIPVIVLLTVIHVSLYLKSKSYKGILVSTIPLLLAVYYYPSFIVLAPFGLILPVYDLGKNLYKKNKLLLIVSVILIGFLGIFASLRFGIFNSGSRGMDLAIWRDVNTPWEIDKYRGLSWNSSPTIFSFNLASEKLANKLVYNRAVANINVFTRNYLSFFSPDWLFLRGDAILRHSTGQVGAFFPFLAPLMIYGVFVFFAKKPTNESNELTIKKRITFLIWILASPIPAAITKDGAGYLLRVVTLLPFLTYFCSLGLIESFNLIKNNWRIPYGILVASIGIYSAYYFFYGYFHVYPALAARSYEYGFKELSDFQVAKNNATMLVVWDGYYHNNDFRFWQETPFDQYKSFKLKTFQVGESTFNQTFPNLYFVNPKTSKDIFEFVDIYHPEYVVLPDKYFVNYPKELEVDLGTPSAVIKYPDRTDALRIFSVK